MAEKERTVEFRRDFAKIDRREIWADTQKWDPFLRLLDESKGKVDVVVIDSPEVLGDTYREFVVNLAAISEAGLKLLIRPGGTKIVGRMSVGKTGKEVFETEASETPGFIPKKGRGILRIGRKPTVVLMSYAPDELYAQAELLVMLEKEIFKPSNVDREIEGCYETGPGTVDSFFEEWIDRPDDLRLLEKKRMEIIEKGWNNIIFMKEVDPQPSGQPEGRVTHRLISKDSSINDLQDLMQTVIKDLKKAMKEEKSFLCACCMAQCPEETFENIGFFAVEGANHPITKLGALPYPICKKCSGLSRERLFSKVEENLQSYGNKIMKEHLRQKNEIGEAVEAIDTLESMMDSGLNLELGDNLDTMPKEKLVEVTKKVKALSQEIQKAGSFVCVCCTKKKSAKHLDGIGSHFKKDEGNGKLDVYPMCDKCSELPTNEAMEQADRNVKEGKV